MILGSTVVLLNSEAPLPKEIFVVRRSPASGQLALSSNLRVTPKDKDMICMSLNLPWKRRSSSECQPQQAKNSGDVERNQIHKKQNEQIKITDGQN
eukprot:687294-Amphidinium_carterae.1